ncbi:NAD-dependent epimerase/dehydratase family protein [Kribbella qitaiheensis]|uniref:NAD-dependent epimerase/dehydratase family protein n=1 Tax=Kribbella qitaiheensis TaxID=1544730 RepID=A0A7G6WW69_9ACTN|nr:NAD-dependent epimerase/dehydratase family protein [Kribbella qitaiheensis]QNE18234.1 NAD-dependent epimerase/dehydratase family protein [Kribbella qitaiheensis]
MRLLVLGGSWFVGSAVVGEARARGHDVTLFNRGLSNARPLRDVRHVSGDWEQEADLRRLAAAGPWDAVIDVAGTIPRLVRRCAEALSPVAGHYVFVSTISAYRDWPHKPVDETSTLWDAPAVDDPGRRSWDPDAYGPLKVGCELAAADVFGTDGLLIVRPHVVLGPREYVGRLPWWLRRVHRGGEILVPAPDRNIQPVDVRDLATFIVDRAESTSTGIYNVAAPQGREQFSDLIAACAEATGRAATVVWADEEWLIEQGVRQWTEIPLWRALPTAWSMSTSKAEAAGLRCRSIRETAVDTWAWMQDGGRAVDHERTAEHGISVERETALLAAWRQR